MVICIDLGATEIKVAPMTKTEYGVSLGAVRRFSTNAAGGKDAIAGALQEAIASQLCAETEGVAIASAGDIDVRKSVITYATENLPGMIGFDFGAFCQQNFRLPSKALNDAQAALLGEMEYGAGREHRSQRVVMLTLGSGVGGGYYVDGEIVSTPENDFARFGHICIDPNGRVCNCGRRGCPEVYLSGRAIHADAAMLGIDGPDLFEKYAAGAAEYVRYIGIFQDNLRRTLAEIQKTSPFDVCIIGGGVADWMGQQFDGIMGNLGYRIVKAALGNSAGMYGAYAHYCRNGDTDEKD